jgi:hypothetical protein
MVIYARPSGWVPWEPEPGVITIDAELRIRVNTPTLRFDSVGGAGSNVVFEVVHGSSQGFIFNSERSITLNAINDIVLNPSGVVDFSQKQAKNHVLEKWTTSTRPTNPVEGQIGYNTDTHQFEGWNGSTWVILG